MQGLALRPDGAHAIHLEDTQRHVVLRGLSVTGGSPTWDGIRLVGVRNLTIEDAVIEGSAAAIRMIGVRDSTILRTTVKTSQLGIALQDTSGVTLSDNRLSVNEKDLSLARSTRNVLRNNNFSIATGQVALDFADGGASVDNDADGSNVVNGVGLRWYTNLRGTPEAPIVIGDARADLRGISNLAQVIVHNASHVILESPTAKSGIGDGILLGASDNVTLRAPAVEANNRAGLRIVDSRDIRVFNATARANRDGVELSSSSRIHVEGLLSERNGGDGVRVGNSHNVTLEAPRVRSSGRDGFSLSHSQNVTLARCVASGSAGYGVQAAATRDVVVDSCSFGGSRAGGIRLAGAAGGRVSRNTFQSDAHGIVLADTRGVAFDDNSIHPAVGGFGFNFDGPASYDNAIATTNRAHNATVHWHTHIAGASGAPVELQGIAAETPHVTNVAQVMLYRVGHVRLSAAVVANGTADGVVVFGSHNVTVHASASRAHGQHGIRLQGAADFTLSDSVLRRSRGAGLLAEDSPRARLVHNGAVLNGGEGARFVRSEGAVVEKFTSERNGGAGLVVEGARVQTPTTIRDSEMIRNQGGGVVIRGARLDTLANATISDNGGAGLRLESVPTGFAVRNGSFVNHTAAIQIVATHGGTFDENRIVAPNGSIGIEFDAPTSYNHSIPQTNLFNGAAYQWFAHMRGRIDAPLFARNVTVTAPGATNVAQVMLYDVENLTLDDVLASNGRRDGIVIHSSANVTLLDATATRNARDGILVEASRDVRIQGVLAALNLADGIRSERALRLSLGAIDSRENRGWGARLAGSDARVSDATLEWNGAGGLRFDGLGGDGAAHTVARVDAANNAGPGIEIAGARAGVVTNLALLNNTGPGLRASASSIGAILNATVAGNAGGGIYVESSTLAAIANNTLTSNGDDGIRLLGVKSGARIEQNGLQNHTRNIRLGGTIGAHLAHNGISIAPRQTGIWFDDVASYDNEVPPSNTVNNQSVQWFVGIQNQTVEAPTVTLGGITNVAQIMLHRVRNVTLVRPVATDGAADGIVVHQSVGVTLVSAETRANRGYGVALAFGSGHSVDGGTVANNRAGGIFVTSSRGATITGGTVDQNAGYGVRLRAQSDDAVVQDARITSNAAGGVRIEDSAGARIAHNDLATNGGAALHATRASPGLNVTSNAIGPHAAGVRLESTNLGDFTDNEIAIESGQIGFRFDDEASYDNSVRVSNRVNGVPVRWYTALAGSEAAPIVLEDVHVAVENITNVAQVMIHRSAYVHLVGATAVNGSARGIFVHRSSAVELLAPNVSASAVGVHLHATQSSLVDGAAAAGAGIGVRLTASNDNTIRATDARGARIGVELDGASAGNRVNGTFARAVSAASVSDPSVQGNRGNNLLVDSGRDVRAGVQQAVTFPGALAVWRLESERIVRQQWDFGDNTTHDDLSSSSHAYARIGNYTATLRAWTADGKEYADDTRVEIVGPLSAPTNFRAVQGPDTVRLTWDPPLSDGGSEILGYRIFRGNSSANATLLVEVAPPMLEHDDANDAAHVYAVRAVTARGPGPLTKWVLAAPGAPPPVPPTGVTATPAPASVTLAWQPPADDGGLKLDGYRIYRAVGDEKEMILLRTVPADATTLIDAEATNGVEHRYRVAAVNALGESPLSVIAATTPTPLPDAPGVVRALAGDRRVTMTWQAPAAHPAAPILHYRVYRGLSLDDQVLIAQVTDTFHRDEGLSNSGEYGYSVSAVTRVGEGPRTEPLLAAPLPVDETPPWIRLVMPAPDSFTIELRPPVVVEFVDDGLTVETSLFFDGELVARERGDVPYIIWTPRPALTPGIHVAAVRLVDSAGLVTEKTWSFRKLSPDEELPRLSWENFTLDAPLVVTGGSVAVNVTVRNVGYVDFDGPVHLLAENTSWASVPLRLPRGESANVTLEAQAENPGVYTLRVGDATGLPLTVRDAASPGETDDAPAAQQPRPRRVPRPLADPVADGGADVPAPGLGLALLVLALAARSRRRR